MPQLDIDLFDDFLFFAFVALLFGFGDEEGEEGVVEASTDAHLAGYYMETRKELEEQKRLIKGLFAFSILKSK
jgi:hypothetical protein